MYDSDTGLLHFGYREYDPTIGRFISPDPLGYAGGDVDLYGYCLDDPINFVDRDGLKGRSEKEDDGDSGSEDKNHSITGMDMRKERQALKEKAKKQSPESEAESSDAEKEEKGALEKISDGVGKAVTEGGKAALEAVSKAGEAIADDPRIWGTATGAALLPAAIAGGTLSGEAALSAGAAGASRAAPYLEKGVGKLSKAVKRGKDFVKDVAQRTEAKIGSSRIGKYIDSNDIIDGATAAIEGLPPSQSRGGAGVAVANDLYTRYKNHTESNRKGNQRHAKE